VQRAERLQGTGRLQDDLTENDAVKNRFGLPSLGVGLGLRTTHYAHILAERPAVDWFEILSENYMQTRGRPLAVLDQIAETYPIAMHGVSLSIGSNDELDWDYLVELKTLKERVRARWVSDHLAWTGIAGRNTHDLLPVPFTEEALVRMAEKIRQVQSFLEAPLVLENPSSYVEMAGAEMTEWEFLAALAHEADCGILLDVNNVYVSAFNHGFDPHAYLARVPYERVVQLHVGGHTRHETHMIDTHIGPVIEPVWELFAEAYRRAGVVSTLLEWDAEIPPFEVAHEDALRAHAYIDALAAGAA
jgi:uncharacterized protein (UPF0276 family)